VLIIAQIIADATTTNAIVKVITRTATGNRRIIAKVIAMT
jgi:hypothetical protein